MTTFDRVLIYVTLTFCVCCVMVLIAAIALPDFRDNGAGIALGVLGAFATFGGMLGLGSYMTRDLKEAPQEEAQQKKERPDDR